MKWKKRRLAVQNFREGFADLGNVGDSCGSGKGIQERSKIDLALIPNDSSRMTKRELGSNGVWENVVMGSQWGNACCLENLACKNSNLMV